MSGARVLMAAVHLAGARGEPWKLRRTTFFWWVEAVQDCEQQSQPLRLQPNGEPACQSALPRIDQGLNLHQERP